MNLTKDEIGELKERHNQVLQTYLDLYRAEQSHRRAQQEYEAFLHKLQFRREPREAPSA